MRAQMETASLIMYSNQIDFPAKHSRAWTDFVRRALQKQPHLRPTAVQLLAHPWLALARGGPRGGAPTSAPPVPYARSCAEDCASAAQLARAPNLAHTSPPWVPGQRDTGEGGRVKSAANAIPPWVPGGGDDGEGRKVTGPPDLIPKVPARGSQVGDGGVRSLAAAPGSPACSACTPADTAAAAAGPPLRPAAADIVLDPARSTSAPPSLLQPAAPAASTAAQADAAGTLAGAGQRAEDAPPADLNHFSIMPTRIDPTAAAAGRPAVGSKAGSKPGLRAALALLRAPSDVVERPSTSTRAGPWVRPLFTQPAVLIPPPYGHRVLLIWKSEEKYLCPLLACSFEFLPKSECERTFWHACSKLCWRVRSHVHGQQSDFCFVVADLSWFVACSRVHTCRRPLSTCQSKPSGLPRYCPALPSPCLQPCNLVYQLQLDNILLGEKNNRAG